MIVGSGAELVGCWWFIVLHRAGRLRSQLEEKQDDGPEKTKKLLDLFSLPDCFCRSLSLVAHWHDTKIATRSWSVW